VRAGFGMVLFGGKMCLIRHLP